MNTAIYFLFNFAFSPPAPVTPFRVISLTGTYTPTKTLAGTYIPSHTLTGN